VELCSSPLCAVRSSSSDVTLLDAQLPGRVAAGKHINHLASAGEIEIKAKFDEEK